MPQFFINTQKISGTICIIEGDDFRQLVKVRRAKCGQLITLRDENGKKIEAEIVKINKDNIEASIKNIGNPKHTQADITLYLSILKGSNFELAIQKATEIGISRIVPIISERSIPLLKGKEENKISRWQKILTQASKQSLREDIPKMEDILDFKKAVSDNKQGNKIIAHPGVDLNIKNYLQNTDCKKISLFIGPEGGYSEEEIKFAQEHEITPVNFGLTCLRAETAVIVMTSIIVYEWSI